MIDEGKKNVLGIGVDVVDYEGAIRRIVSTAKAKQGMTVTALAVHGVMTGVHSSDHRYRLNHLDLVTPDGQPVRWALNWLYGVNLPDRVYGPNLMLRICDQAEKESLPIYFYGNRTSVIKALRANLKNIFPNLVISGMMPSYFRQISPSEKLAVVKEIESSGAALTLVGLGCPRQEVWVYEHHKLLQMPLIAVGAAFDFFAGSLPQAPDYLQTIGMEWFYRLLMEPERLWKRYILLNPQYMWLLLLQKLGLKRFNEELDDRPMEELRYG